MDRGGGILTPHVQHFGLTLPGKVSPEDPDLGSESEDEEQVEGNKEAKSAGIKMPEPDPDTGVYDETAISGHFNEAHALHSMETVKAIKTEMADLLTKVKQEPIPELDQDHDPLSPFRTKEGPPQDDLDGLPPQTARDVMGAAGLKKFEPEDGDTEEQCLERIRKLCPPMRAFVKRVRVTEKILSKAQIHGRASIKGRHQLLEHLLARLRRKYSLQGSRQSRFAAWAFFSKTVSEKACRAVDDLEVAAELKQIIPSCCTDSDGNRLYQIVACRLHLIGKIEFALVEEVLRGSLDKKGRRKGKKLSEVGLESHLVGAVRGVMLQPVEVEKSGDRVYKCTCRSPAAILQVADPEGVLLWSLPPAQYHVRETGTTLFIHIKKQAVEACSVIHGTGGQWRGHGSIIFQFIFHYIPYYFAFFCTNITNSCKSITLSIT